MNCFLWGNRFVLIGSATEFEEDGNRRGGKITKNGIRNEHVQFEEYDARVHELVALTKMRLLLLILGERDWYVFFERSSSHSTSPGSEILPSCIFMLYGSEE